MALWIHACAQRAITTFPAATAAASPSPARAYTTPEISGGGGLDWTKSSVWHGDQDFWSAFSGGFDYDRFFEAVHLQNGWTVQFAALYPFAYSELTNNLDSACGDASVSYSHAVNSALPADAARLWIHWSHNAWCDVNYTLAEVIVGPRGVPDGQVCKQQPCN